MATKYAYQKEMYHNGLKKTRTVKAQSKWDFDLKVVAVEAKWEEEWKRKQERERIQRQKRQISLNHEMSKNEAEKQTIEAEENQERMINFLSNSLKERPFDFSTLKIKRNYPEEKPRKPVLETIPREPLRSDPDFNPKPNFLTNIIPSKKRRLKELNDEYFETVLKSWENIKANILQANQIKLNLFEDSHRLWKLNKDKFDFETKEMHLKIDELENRFKNGDENAIEEIYDEILNSFEMPFDFNFSWDFDYRPKNKSVVIDVLLPVIEDLPKLKKVDYIKTKSEFKDTYFNDSYMKSLYDSLIYSMVLVVLHKIFINDKNKFIEMITLNGKVNTIDKSNGREISPYILSVTVDREKFQSLNLQNIDPKSWFRASKGISGATFTDVTPVAPLINISREDSRFIDGREVISSIGSETNLATMDWQDFENLIREIFEKEFNSTGGEVKITQASRDGGVDAVAFDPDPIRGGKIVIQAKRYTNVVGVSAVRDLYGTVMNEGATKGILVTTAYYGKDAYNFANGKPLTLLDGSNLLYLLEKHGHKARIDVNELKK